MRSVPGAAQHRAGGGAGHR